MFLSTKSISSKNPRSWSLSIYLLKKKLFPQQYKRIGVKESLTSKIMKKQVLYLFLSRRKWVILCWQSLENYSENASYFLIYIYIYMKEMKRRKRRKGKPFWLTLIVTLRKYKRWLFVVSLSWWKRRNAYRYKRGKECFIGLFLVKSCR